MIRIVAPALLASLAMTAFSARAEEAVSAPSRAPKNKDEVVCKRSIPTGTRFAKSICYTRAEWEDISEQDKRKLRDAQGPVINAGKD